jgi:hypothetical protein
MNATAEMTLSEFANHLGKKGSWVTQLKQDGRLVLTDDGKRVRVAESVARIEATRDPSMQGVADHHAAARAVKATAPAAAAQPPETQLGTEKIGSTYQAARAVKEQYLARAAKRDYELSIGKLLVADDVRHALAAAATTLRARLEALPDTLGPQLAPITDEHQTRATLAEAIEHTLAELAREFGHIATLEATGEQFPQG